MKISVLFFLFFFKLYFKFWDTCADREGFYIGIHMPWWFSAPINPSSTLVTSPHAISPLPPIPDRPLCVMFTSLCPSVLIMQLPLMSKNMQYLIFYSCINLLRMMVSSFIHVPVKNMNSIFFVAVQYSMMYMCHIFFIQSIVDGHLGW